MLDTLPREMVESPSLEIFRVIWVWYCHMLKVALHEQGC